MRFERHRATGVGLLLIHLGALAAFLPQFFSWPAIVVALIIYNLTGGIGITLAYHRVLTHRSLTLWRPVEYAAAILGALALQGGP
ncbi:MAG: acyl-CoA desaturase, partial [Candidatus Eremiobacteraeota bacterium]|nr:acyl-CoA desaturase [Candidatus Eremiobacteraeota bacterium]